MRIETVIYGLVITDVPALLPGRANTYRFK
jgi:hypothetical protein